MEYSNLVDVKKHEMFPTVIHSFSLDIDDYDMKNMTTYIKSNQKKVDLYQTEDDLHITSFFRPLYIKILEVNEEDLTNCQVEVEINEKYVSNEIEIAKPSINIFKLILEDFNLNPENIIHIGDNIFTDIFGAKKAGFSAIYVNKRKSVDNELEFNPDYTVADISELL